MNRHLRFRPILFCLALGSACTGTEGNVFLERNGVTGDSGGAPDGSGSNDGSTFVPDGGADSDASFDTDGGADTDASFDTDGGADRDCSVFTCQDTDGGADTDASFDTDGGADTDASFDPDAGDGGIPNVDCTQNPPVFPSFDRSCTVAADCAIGMVQIDCCGSQIVTGINETEAQRFADAAALCNSQFPLCGCPTQSTRADDGTREGAFSGPAIVQCVSNACQTTFTPNPTPCGGNSTCDPFTDVCVATSPIGPAIQYSCEPIPAGCEQDRSCSCAGVSLCSPPYDTCTDQGPNSISCECLQCA
jgi:hypothetical protein